MCKKPWLLQCSQTYCKLPHHLYWKSNHHISLRRVLCKNQLKSMLKTAGNRQKVDTKHDTATKTEKTLPGSSQTSPKRVQDASRTPPRLLQEDASEPPTRRLKIVYEATRAFKPPPSHAEDSSKRRPNTKMGLEAASEKPPRWPGTSPRRFQIGISDENMLCWSPPMQNSSKKTQFEDHT